MERMRGSQPDIVRSAFYASLAASLAALLASVADCDGDTESSSQIGDIRTSVVNGARAALSPSSHHPKRSHPRSISSPENARLSLSADDLLEFPRRDVPEVYVPGAYIVNRDMRNSEVLDKNPSLNARYEAAVERLVFDTEDGKTLHVYLPDENFSVYFEIQHTQYEGEDGVKDLYQLMRYDDKRREFVVMGLSGAALSTDAAQRGMREDIQTELISFLIGTGSRSGGPKISL